MEDSGSKLCTEVLTLLPSSRFPGSWFIAQPPSHTFMQWHFGFASHLQWPHRSGFAPDSLFTSTVRPVRMHLIILWNYTYLCYHCQRVQSTPIWCTVTIQPFGFIATKTCTQTAKTAVWRVAASGLPCECKATPRGTMEGWTVTMYSLLFCFHVFFLS